MLLTYYSGKDIPARCKSNRLCTQLAFLCIPVSSCIPVYSCVSLHSCVSLYSLYPRISLYSCVFLCQLAFLCIPVSACIPVYSCVSLHSCVVTCQLVFLCVVDGLSCKSNHHICTCPNADASNTIICNRSPWEGRSSISLFCLQEAFSCGSSVLL